MAPALDLDVIKSSVLPVVVNLVTDRIPNIRFNVAKALGTLSVTLSLPSDGSTAGGGRQLVAESIVPQLEKLSNDPDADVRFFAERALETAHAVANGLPVPNQAPVATSQPPPTSVPIGSTSLAPSSQPTAINEVTMTDA